MPCYIRLERFEKFDSLELQIAISLNIQQFKSLNQVIIQIFLKDPLVNQMKVISIHRE